METKIFKNISELLDISLSQISQTIKLFDEGSSVPFIARYRKEITGNLDEEQIRDIIEKVTYFRNLEKRKEEVIRLIEEQGKLTKELETEILAANVLQRVEDLYLPYKKKKKTKADIAIENGLEPLAEYIKQENITEEDFDKEAIKYINENVKDVKEAKEGVSLILAQEINENAMLREYLRNKIMEKGTISTKLIEKNKELDEKQVYKDYYDHNEKLEKIESYRILAINRAEDKKIISVSLNIEEGLKNEIVNYFLIKNFINLNLKDFFIKAIIDSLDRLMYPSVENEIRNHYTEMAQEEAIKNFSKNLENLLLQPPLNKKNILGLDPGYRTGAKLVIIDKDGFYKTNDVVFVVKGMHSENQITRSKNLILKYIKEYDIDIIAIGNGTASRETESFIAEILKDYKEKKISYLIVNEAGASVYSASKIAAEEFPDLDVTVRGTISISRRIQDPLAELVKIDPKSMGIGMYQHDVNQKKLTEKLEETIESIVNKVGVNINSASFELLSYVSGIKKNIAKNIVEYRKNNGDFKNREEILNVKGLGNKAFEQLAGFIVIPDSENPLDNTIIHPESYNIAIDILKEANSSLEELKLDLKLVREKLKNVNLENIFKKYNLEETVKDIYDALIRDRRDPRDDFDKPLLREDILKIEDLKEGMVLEGTVRNVTQFGAFVDIGLKNDAMIHKSKLASEFVSNPTNYVSVGQIIKVVVLKVDIERQRVELSSLEATKPKVKKNKKPKFDKEEYKRKKLEEKLINMGWKIKK